MAGTGSRGEQVREYTQQEIDAALQLLTERGITLGVWRIQVVHTSDGMALQAESSRHIHLLKCDGELKTQYKITNAMF